MSSKSKFNIRLSSAVARYLDRIKHEGQSKTSQKTAYYALHRLQKAVATRSDPDPYVHLITDVMMDDYCYGPDGLRAGSDRWGNKQTIAAVSFNRYRSVLVNFFNHAELMRWTDLSPMAGIRPARPDTPTEKLLLSATEMVSLLEVASNPIERIGCALGMNTGLRSNDVRHLTVFDANLNNGTIQTEIRKTHKLDVKPMTMELESELVRWLDIYAEMTGHRHRSELPNDYLLVPSYRNTAPNETRKWKAVPRPTDVHSKPWVLVQRPLAALGYKTRGQGFHTLRRSSARALFESLRASGDGRDHALMIVKDFLNHASVTQTEAYLGLSHERVMRDALLRGKSFLGKLASNEQSELSGGEKVHRIGA